MTDTIEAPETDAPETDAPKTDAPKRGRKPGSGDRNFNAVADQHVELADFVNKNSGLDPVSPNQVKAVLFLRTDFANTPEQIARREARKAEREAAEAKYAGLNDAQKKVQKQADRAAAHAERLRVRAEEEFAKAQQLAAAVQADGADLAAAVEAQEAEAKAKPMRRSRAAK